MRRTDLVLYCGVLNLALDVVLNLVLMRWMGVAGIALALMAVMSIASGWLVAGRLLRPVRAITAVSSAFAQASTSHVFPQIVDGRRRSYE